MLRVRAPLEDPGESQETPAHAPSQSQPGNPGPIGTQGAPVSTVILKFGNAVHGSNNSRPVCTVVLPVAHVFPPIRMGFHPIIPAIGLPIWRLIPTAPLRSRPATTYCRNGAISPKARMSSGFILHGTKIETLLENLTLVSELSHLTVCQRRVPAGSGNVEVPISRLMAFELEGGWLLFRRKSSLTINMTI
jgi:hypothetical protein